MNGRRSAKRFKANIIPSESNRITVINDGDNFEIQLNDYPVFNFTDSRFHGGTFGLAAEAPKGTQLAV
ncbi:MAG TPA: hypothetical protein PLG96_10905, partial [Flexilinea sp.]|nr:hypothetical protein [Flexilinea sp.]